MSGLASSRELSGGSKKACCIISRKRHYAKFREMKSFKNYPYGRESKVSVNIFGGSFVRIGDHSLQSNFLFIEIRARIMGTCLFYDLSFFEVHGCNQKLNSVKN
jgi:hypothetical protein